MKKRVLEWTGSSMTFILAVVLVIPFSRYFLFGIIGNERFDDGRMRRPAGFRIGQRADVRAGCGLVQVELVGTTGGAHVHMGFSLTLRCDEQ